MPRARLADEAGEREWNSGLLPAYKRLSHRAEALIAEAYLAGMNTRRVRRALVRLFEGHVGKDVVSRFAGSQDGRGGRPEREGQRPRSAWEAWQRRDLAGDDIVRLILDGTVVKVRLDRKATAISLLIALGVRRDGQKACRSAPTTEVGAGSQARLAIKNMGGESEAAWRAVLDDLTSRGLTRPDLVIVDGGKGLEAALASLWDDLPVQRCTVPKERNLLAHAPKHLHDQIKAEFNDMVHAETAEDVLAKRKIFLATWKLRCRSVADSLEEAGERLFTFLRYPPEPWRSLRTTNAIERLHEEFKRRIKTQCLLPCAMHHAGRDFQAAFIIANLDPLRAVPILRVPGTGREPELNERRLDARRRVHEAMAALAVSRARRASASGMSWGCSGAFASGDPTGLGWKAGQTGAGARHPGRGTGHAGRAFRVLRGQAGLPKGAVLRPLSGSKSRDRKRRER